MHLRQVCLLHGQLLQLDFMLTTTMSATASGSNHTLTYILTARACRARRQQLLLC